MLNVPELNVPDRMGAVLPGWSSAVKDSVRSVPC